MSQTTIVALKAIVGDAHVKTDPADLEIWGQDWTRFFRPAPLAIILPKTIEEVQAIVRFANEAGLALVPSGGRTGLSGGAVAENGELVVSFDRMNRIRDFHPVDRTVVCEAGVVTAQLQAFAREKELFYPVDFASAGSSQIGGNIATNAGGINVIKYGMTRDWVAGLRVVTGSGELMNLNAGLVKNNTGYDFRHLFVGSEGTLGLIVEATMRLTTPPAEQTVMVLGVNNFADMMEILRRFRADLSLTAFEFFSDEALQYVMKHRDKRRPLDEVCPYYALIEFEHLHASTEDQALAALEDCMAQGWVVDGVMSQSLAQRAGLWESREGISESITYRTPHKNDIAVVTSKVPDFLADIEAVVKAHYPDFEIIWFGHIGDGNLHLNILCPEGMDKAAFLKGCKTVNRFVYDIVRKYEGSVSAEHGIGLLKKDSLMYTRSEAEMAVMRSIRKAFDPNGIMNPGKIFD
jgi:FAD/FMN-containing dehydrogenase